MTRTELEGLDRDDLVARAEAAGVTRARILTRAELVDELLLRSAADEESKRRSRGFFGLARDLLASVVEQGLNLPDAAERIRALGAPPPQRRSAPAALPTVTLAEIYAAQGHRDRAIDTLESVLAREPDHATARALLAKLRDSSFPVPEPQLPPEPDEAEDQRPSPDDASVPRPSGSGSPEPLGMLDDTPLPPRYDVNECVAIPVDPTTLYVYWEVRGDTLARARASRGSGVIAVRVLVVLPGWEGPRSSTRDEDVSAPLGEVFLRDLPPGCVVRAAVGLRTGDGFFPFAHSPALETPPGSPSALLADTLVRWTPQGTVPLSPGDPDAASVDRALGRIRREAERARREALRAGAPLGSSEQWRM
jgi:hypothetical protein